MVANPPGHHLTEGYATAWYVFLGFEDLAAGRVAEIIISASYIAPIEVDEVRVTTVVDNTIDVLMVSTDVAERYMLGPKWLSIVSQHRVGTEFVFRAAD